MREAFRFRFKAQEDAPILIDQLDEANFDLRRKRKLSPPAMTRIQGQSSDFFARTGRIFDDETRILDLARRYQANLPAIRRFVLDLVLVLESGHPRCLSIRVLENCINSEF